MVHSSGVTAAIEASRWKSSHSYRTYKEFQDLQLEVWDKLISVINKYGVALGLSKH